MLVRGVFNMVMTRTSIYCGESYFDRPDSDIFFDDIPPFIGCLISDKAGKLIVSFEVFEGAISHHMKESNLNKQLEKSVNVDLIPMFVSAIEMLSEELNIQNVPEIEINGSNIKLHILFCLDNLTITFFLNPRVNFKLIKDTVKNYLGNLFEEYKSEFMSALKIGSHDFISFLERLGWCFLLDLNNKYLSKI